MYVCGLPDGDYTLFAESGLPRGAAPSMGALEFTIDQHDEGPLPAPLRPALAMSGETRWDTAPKSELKGQTATLILKPIHRGAFLGEGSPVRAAIPGEFTVSRLSTDDYSLQVMGLRSDLYVKSATVAGHDLLREPLTPGRYPNATISLVIANDGGGIWAIAKDQDGKPVPDMFATALPDDSPDVPFALAVRWSRQTDQEGRCLLDGLAPGKYPRGIHENGRVIHRMQARVTPHSFSCWSHRARMDAYYCI